VSPNPANSFITIRFPPALLEMTGISVRDISGRVVLEQEVLPFQQSVSLDIAGLRPGIYFLDFGRDDTLFTRKLVVQ
jgi:hypothetical protein